MFSIECTLVFCIEIKEAVSRVRFRLDRDATFAKMRGEVGIPFSFLPVLAHDRGRNPRQLLAERSPKIAFSFKAVKELNVMNPINIDQEVPLTMRARCRPKEAKANLGCVGSPKADPKQLLALLREKTELERKLRVQQRVSSVPIKRVRYAEWIRLDDSEILHVNVQFQDCGTLLPFLRASNLQFDFAEHDLEGEQLTFHPGTTITQVHAALVRFDELNGQSP